jgi:hypothetical protein
MYATSMTASGDVRYLDLRWGPRRHIRYSPTYIPPKEGRGRALHQTPYSLQKARINHSLLGTLYANQWESYDQICNAGCRTCRKGASPKARCGGHGDCRLDGALRRWCEGPSLLLASFGVRVCQSWHIASLYQGPISYFLITLCCSTLRQCNPHAEPH